MGTANVEVEVVYTPNPHTVTWILDGGSINDSTENIVDNVVFGDAIDLPGTPEKAGYDFAGWIPAVAQTVADQDYEYTATYEAKSFELKYIVENVSTGTTETITRYLGYGDEIATDVYTAPAGYPFHGWFTDSAYETGLSADATIFRI